MRASLRVLLAAAVLTQAPVARAYPGIIVAKDDAPRSVRSTSAVLMQHEGFAVVTLMAEVAGPLTPFAFLIPIPSDVTKGRLRTVRRATLARVESVTAPRLHAFYEQDPCDGAATQQAWEEHVKPGGRGFLTPEFVPPPDRHYAVSNAISKAIEPVFKEGESEYRYEIFDFDAGAALVARLAKLGYRIPAAGLAALASIPRAGTKLLFAEVSPARVELAADGRQRLGGIRYWSRAPQTTLRESLSPQASSAGEELFVYVFDRATRYQVKTQPNVFLPTNLAVEPRAGEKLAGVYTALFEAGLRASPGAVVTEYAWPTSGCGEPCPDAPLGVDELMTLGGDVLEANTTSAAERVPEPGPEPVLERERFETHLAEVMPGERPALEREHAAERKELARRGALERRQTYVLTRLHQRHDALSKARDVELTPAPPVTGGAGIPHGAGGELSTLTVASSENRLQQRFISLYPWTRGVACADPQRGRWGKRWASEARVSRAVPLALDLASATPDRALLQAALARPVPELALDAHPTPQVAPVPSSPPPTPSVTDKPAPAPPHGCNVAQGSRSHGAVLVWLALMATGGWGRRRSRR